MLTHTDTRLTPDMQFFSAQQSCAVLGALKRGASRQIKRDSCWQFKGHESDLFGKLAEPPGPRERQETTESNNMQHRQTPPPPPGRSDELASPGSDNTYLSLWASEEAVSAGDYVLLSTQNSDVAEVALAHSHKSANTSHCV